MGKRVQKVSLNNLSSKTLDLGYMGEHEHTRIEIDCTEVLWDYPNATASMVVQPPTGDMYPLTPTREDDTIVWLVTDSDVANHGTGSVQITFTNNGEIVKSAIGSTRVRQSIVATGEAPDPIQTWIDQAEETAAEIAAEAAAGVVDDLEEAKDAAIEAIEAKGEETIESIPEDYTNLSNQVTDLKTANSQLIDPVTGAFNAGIARKIISDQYATDKAPYNFRPAFDADFLEDKIVGGTIVWNQLCNTLSVGGDTKGLTFTFATNGETTISGTSTAGDFKNIGSLPANHLILVTATPSFPEGFSFGTSYANTRREHQFVSGTGTQYVRVAFQSGVTPAYHGYINAFDLTAMLGSTIADYIAALETATTGAGFAWFKKYFPYTYAYNAGTLESVQTSARKVVGFNQWDEEWENGSISGSTGANQTDSNCIRSKNYMKCIPGETYAGCALSKTGQYVVRMLFYDSAKQFISAGSWFPYATTIAPANASYFRISTQASTGVNLYGGTYQNDICINISDTSRNGTYESYEAKTYPLDSDLVLRGIPKLDSGNNLYYDGDVYEADGTVTRRYGVVDLSSLTWTAWDNGRVYSTGLSSEIKSCNAAALANIVASKYNSVPAGDISYNANLIGIGINNTNVVVRTGDANNPTGYLVYELATPTTAEADPFATGQLCYPDGTEEYVDAGVTATTPTRDVSIPVGGERKYYKDFRREVREMIAEMQALILEN